MEELLLLPDSRMAERVLDLELIKGNWLLSDICRLSASCTASYQQSVQGVDLARKGCERKGRSCAGSTFAPCTCKIWPSHGLHIRPAQ